MLVASTLADPAQATNSHRATHPQMPRARQPPPCAPDPNPGMANLACGISLCGFTGSYIFSQTVFSQRMGVTSRSNGWVVVAVEAAAFLAPVEIVQVCICGGVEAISVCACVWARGRGICAVVDHTKG